MLHPQLLAELLDDEVAVAAGLGDRAESLGHDGRYVRCRVCGRDGSLLWLRMDAAGFAVDVCDDAGETVVLERWPAGLAHNIHPVHGRPWVCTRGTAEYHTYPGHHVERWDTYRATLRLPDLLDHLLRRAGRP